MHKHMQLVQEGKIKKSKLEKQKLQRDWSSIQLNYFIHYVWSAAKLFHPTLVSLFQENL